jgi:hypothetical protein
MDHDRLPRGHAPRLRDAHTGATAMTKHLHLWSAAPIAAAFLTGPVSGQPTTDNGEERETPFDEARLFFELNDTDGDLGIHALIDGSAWKRLEIDGPNDVVMLEVFVRNRLRKQGLTEFFFESAEPPFDELPPTQFFKRFPEGVYDIGGLTLDGKELESEVTLSHVLAAPPENIQISGVDAAENCDAEPLPSVSEPVTISWDPVTQSHPDIGTPNVAVEVEQYELILEIEEPTERAMSIPLPPDVTSFEFPSDFIALSDAFKFEIIVRAVNGNQTAVESCFEIE